MKCAICKSKVQETFLQKPIGTYVKDKKGKRKLVCMDYQKNLKTKDKIVEKL